jgi:hypothetical protein
LRLEGGSRRGFASMMKGFDHVPYSSPPVITDENEDSFRANRVDGRQTPTAGVSPDSR